MSKKAERIIRRCIRKVCEDIPEFAIVLDKLELKEVEEPIKLSTDWRHILYNAQEVEEKYYSRRIKILKSELVHIVLHGILEDIEELRSDRFLDDVFRNAQIDCRADVMSAYLGYDSVDRCFYGSIEDIIMIHHSKINIGSEEYLKILERGEDVESDEHEFWRKSNDLDQDDTVFGEGIEEKLEICLPPIEEWQILKRAIVEQSNGVESMEEAIKTFAQVRKTGDMARRGSEGFEILVEAEMYEEKSYQDIIRELVKKESETKEMPDTIDPMLYQYGLELYGDVPIIEPNEEEGKNNMGTLFIAVDTSGSCQGETLKNFLKELKTLFKDLRNEYAGGKIVLLHCDDRIHKEEVFELDELDEFGKKHSFYGSGGTSFVPVFERIEKYIKKEKDDVVGLVYLTDGDGECTEQKPKYPVYFVMEEHDYERHTRYSCLPKWIKEVKF